MKPNAATAASRGADPSPRGDRRRKVLAMAGVRQRTSLPVALVATPRLLAPGSLPGHRALSATLVNRSGGPLELDARDLSLIDPDGRRLRAAVQFGARHSKVVQLAPGDRVELTAAWRGEAVAALHFGADSLWG